MSDNINQPAKTEGFVYKLIRLVPASFRQRIKYSFSHKLLHIYFYFRYFRCLNLKQYWDKAKKSWVFPVGDKQVIYPKASKCYWSLGPIASCGIGFVRDMTVASIANQFDELEPPYEDGEVKVSDGDVVIDCGGNIALFSFFSAARNNATAYCFEPLPANGDVIKIVLAANPELDVILCPFAVADKSGIVKFTASDTTSGEMHIGGVEGEKTIDVQAISLDEWAEENKLEKIDFIKSDIEGAERYMLKGAKNIIKKFAPKLSISNYHLPDDPKIIRELILEANPNYKIKEIEGLTLAWCSEKRNG